MSKYTTSFNAFYDSIDTSIIKVFDFEYDFYTTNDTYKKMFENKFVRHYYFEEIGYETMPQFKFKLSEKLNLIMPYYKKIYETTLLNYNPLFDVYLKENLKHKGDNKFKGENNAVSNQTDKGANDYTNNDTFHDESQLNTSFNSGERVRHNQTINRDTDKKTDTLYHNQDITYHHDTPQGNLQQIQDGSYLTDLKKTVSDSTNSVTDKEKSKTDDNYTHETDVLNGTQTTTTDNNTKKTEYKQKTSNVSDNKSNLKTNTFNEDSYLNELLREGKVSSITYAEMIEKERNVIINIDKMIIDELECLFMSIY